MLCLTVDIDWAPDDVIQDTYQLIRASGIKTTWFATHATPMLDVIRATPNHSIGLHPNFNPTLAGHGLSAADVLTAIQAIVPEATAIRSHSLVRSSQLSSLFATYGLTHETNIFVHPKAASTLVPWRCFTGPLQVPIVWEDDVRLFDATLGDPWDWIGKTPVLTVDFHPIHVFINSASQDDYDRAKPHYHDPAALLAHRREAGPCGTRDRLVELLRRATSDSLPNALITEIAA